MQIHSILHRQEMAVFHSIIHCLRSCTTSTIRYEAELKYIHHLDQINGYYKSEIDNIPRKHIMKKHRSVISTFFDDPKDTELVRRRYLLICHIIPFCEKSSAII